MCHLALLCLGVQVVSAADLPKHMKHHNAETGGWRCLTHVTPSNCKQRTNFFLTGEKARFKTPTSRSLLDERVGEQEHKGNDQPVDPCF